MQKALLSLFFILTSLRSFPQECEHFLNDSSVLHASFSICIADAETGKSIMEYNPGRSLTPASVMKLITTAAALELLGPEYRFSTRIGYTGTISKTGKLYGDIIIKGGGDPCLGSVNFTEYYQDFPDEWIEAIKKTGIRKISGRVITDDSYYDYLPVPARWLWEDMGNYYGAGAYGASVFDNSFEIHLTSGPDGSIPSISSIIPEEYGIELSNRLVSRGTTDQGYVYAAPYSQKGWISGSIPENRTDFVLGASITDPPYLISRLITNKLRASGIKIPGNPSTARLEGNMKYDTLFPVSAKYSPPLSHIIEVLNHKSINLYAEHLIKELGKKYMNTGSTKAGIEVIYRFLDSAGINTRGIFIEDGSGLSPENSINSRELVNLLIYMRNKSNYFQEYYNSLPSAGKDGTLKNYFKDEVFESSLKAKSGTLTRVKSYAGYFTAKSGREIVFSMIVNDFTGPSKNIVSRFEEVLKDLILNE